MLMFIVSYAILNGLLEIVKGRYVQWKMKWKNVYWVYVVKGSEVEEGFLSSMLKYKVKKKLR